VFDLDRYDALLGGIRAAQTAMEKGRAFEDLAVYLFSALDGVEVMHRDARMAAEEIDLVLWNAQTEAVLKPWDDVILVECKNWSTAIGAAVLDSFIGKLRRRSCRTGILVAANGVTGGFVSGDGNEVGAIGIIAAALQEGIRVIVLTKDDLEAVTSVDDLLKLIKYRYCGLYVHRVF
jgi:Restriction endonuclease